MSSFSTTSKNCQAREVVLVVVPFCFFGGQLVLPELLLDGANIGLNGIGVLKLLRLRSRTLSPASIREISTSSMPRSSIP
ncbi:hypothetical protein TIFTF001_007651 [Ficus carica]|uniref:Uncharacterized protein n=1 Tax=Ficus carica TaxID=3494 RepID=A0AA87ZS17_FICCA|nr:hypothetical protein TIFTF001_007651 [Ficus carica]